MSEHDDLASDAIRAVCRLAGNADHNQWACARTIIDALRAEERGGGVAERRRLLAEFIVASGGARATIERYVRTVEHLSLLGLEHVARQPVLSIGTVGAMVCTTLAPETKKALVTKFYDQALNNADSPPSREEVRAAVRSLLPDSGRYEDWNRPGDDWSFRTFDRRIGRAGQRDRLPGGVHLNLLHRFLPSGGQVLSAMCNSGSLMDAAQILGPQYEVVGFDLRLDPRVAERHADQFVRFDATREDWSAVRPAGWADLVVVTPPSHSFAAEPETDDPHDLGGIHDVEDYVDGIECVMAGAVRSAAVGGFVAVATRQTSEYTNPTPVPDLHFEVLRMLHACGLMYAASPVVRAPRRADSKPLQGASLYPNVTFVDVYRRVSL